MESAISILHKLRTEYEERIQHYKTVSWVLLIFMFIDFAVFLVAKTDFWGIFGVFMIFGWLATTQVTMLYIKEQQKMIDEFYLEQEVRRKEKLNEENKKFAKKLVHQAENI